MGVKKKPGEPGKELTMEHKARQYGDQMQCHVCGKAWDVNDPEPPECITESELKKARGLEQCKKLRRKLSRSR